ncbi:MAG: cell surface protein SprA, partial [Bacteroides sp.]
AHFLGSKKLKVTALTAEGRRYAIKYKITDKNNIRIENRDSIKIKVSILPGPKPEEQTWYKVMQHATRFAMLVRNISVSYRNTYATTLPGFLPEVGDMLGQKKNGGVFAPGLDFAFGMQNDNYINKAARNNWLINNDSIINPALTNAMEDLQVRVVLEPFRDFKIDLNASRTVNKSRSIQYMFDGMPETRSGNFSMTVISIGSSFDKSKSSNGYQSKTFNKFVNNLDAVQRRVEAQYANAVYPQGAGNNLAGKPFDVANGTIDKYSPDVMIPAFLAAYTGRDAGSSSLNFFPNLLSMMPNWKITYDGLSNFDLFKKYFKSFRLSHAYRSIYSVGSYNTYQSFMSFMGNLGFVENVQTGNPIPSSMFDVSAVSINEQFSPLLGVDMTFKNNMTAKVEYKTTRVLNLSMAANQIVESESKDFVIGLGYKIVDFKIFGSGNDKGKKGKGKMQPISNDLNLRGDFSLRNQSALRRDIQSLNNQATSGNRAFKISCSADYTFSRLLTIRLYYDYQSNTPLISSASYPVSNSDFGVSLKLSLTR